MKKTILSVMLMLITSHVFANQVPIRYVKDIQKISDQYSLEMKSFLKSLDPSITQFKPEQKQQFCTILQRYADSFYVTTDRNRAELPLSYSKLTKQDIINKVLMSKEMEILSGYGIQCELK